MLKLQNDPTFKTKVGISIPGQAKPTDITVEFTYLTKKQVKDFFDHLEGKSDIDALSEIIVGWAGVDTAYSVEALAEMLDVYPSSARDLFSAFSQEVFEAKRKN